MSDFLLDLRHALRSFRRSPGFAAIAVATLALGIGANTAMFSVLYGVLLRPLPYPEPDRLVQFAQRYQGQIGGLGVTWSQYRALDELFAGSLDVTASTRVGFNVFADDRADRVDGLRVASDYFRVLGVVPELGRAFLPAEDVPGGAAVAVISHGLWNRRFAGDPNVVGRTVQLDGVSHTVVGVMPAGFQSIPSADVWSTLAQVANTVGSGQNLEVIARRAPGVPFRVAQTRLPSANAAFHERFRESFSPQVDLDLLPYRESVTSSARNAVQVLFGAIALVLLIACANVANLLMGRAADRRREVAVRVALGATRWRLMRQMLAESIALAFLGGAVGLVLAYWGLQALLSLAPLGLPRTHEIVLDRWALVFTFAASVITGVGFGLLPAWQAAHLTVHDALKEGSRRTTGGARQGRLRSVLVVAEIGLSLVLLMGAGLLGQTFLNLVRSDPGFDTRGLLTAEIWLTGSRHNSTETASSFYASLTEQLNAYPGVQGAGVVEAGVPLQRGGNMPLALDGEPANASVEYRTVTPDYLSVLGVPLIRGRMFTAADAGTAEPVAIVNRVFARRFLGDDGLGRMVRIGGAGNADRRVVGVVGDLKSFVGYPAAPAVFIPSAQTPAGITRVFGGWFPTHVVVRTAGDPAALRATLARVIHETDAHVPVGRVRTMEEILSGSLAFQRFLAVLLGVFAAVALLLAAVGVYGVMSYFAAQRTHEIGVRVALGALPGDVVRLVLRRGLTLTGLGVTLGLAGAWGLTRVLASQLFGVRPTDPVTFTVVSLGLTLLALGACAMPALRAARLDPVEALRDE